MAVFRHSGRYQQTPAITALMLHRFSIIPYEYRENPVWAAWEAMPLLEKVYFLFFHGFQCIFRQLVIWSCFCHLSNRIPGYTRYWHCAAGYNHPAASVKFVFLWTFVCHHLEVLQIHPLGSLYCFKRWLSTADCPYNSGGSIIQNGWLSVTDWGGSEAVEYSTFPSLRQQTHNFLPTTYSNFIIFTPFPCFRKGFKKSTLSLCRPS